MPVLPLKKIAWALCAGLLLGASTTTQAASDSTMRDALEAARNQQWQDVNSAALADHELSGYVEYHRLRGRLPQAEPGQILDFIQRHQDSPLSEWMRGQAISQYGDAGRFGSLLAIADGPPSGAARQCHYYTALVGTQPQQAIEGGRKLWRVGKSQPDACNALFDRLRASGDIAAPDIWERKMLAWQTGETGLMTYLGRLLDSQWQTALESVETVKKDYTALDRTPRCIGPQCSGTAMFYQTAMQGFTRADTTAALSTWQRIAPHLTLSASVQRNIEEELAFYALVREVPLAQSWVDNVLPTLDSQRVLELRVRRALADQDWPAVIRWVAVMVPDEQQDSRWQYWLARAHEQLGNPEAAQTRYQQAARERNFYGFAASERLGQPPQLNLERNHVDESARQAIAKLPAIKRTEALLRINEPGLANSEWLYTVRNASPEQARALADYAAQRGWHARLVQTTIAAGLWDALDWRFPEAYRNKFLHWGNATGVDPYLLMAITRRESAYNPDALSPAGARGLMQLMPGTASQVSREVGISDPGPYGILDPEINIRLGSTYLRDKLARYQNNRLAAAAAYNAGPSRVDRWLTDGPQAFDLFVESIPFRETRDYVQAILSYRVIFESLANAGDTQGVSLLSAAEQQGRYDRSLLVQR
ncbi:transglycosylase SLT domain-containing protein [Vreelandella rituensis]|uniref:Lytic murein transglycosylase n=1 Tax=Vreelandella rituensis TaxID=2282306 RepID=A0A368U534_9GAMM|nr:transglycosylase SLT domain-containing protein [Halomonas rituensis]RCV92228.1 lytic murein transglycosylase [Halomonas rituensis]